MYFFSIASQKSYPQALFRILLLKKFIINFIFQNIISLSSEKICLLGDIKKEHLFHSVCFINIIVYAAD